LQPAPVQVQLPGVQLSVQVAPASHCSCAPPPADVSVQVAPDAHASRHPPPEHDSEHVARGGHEAAQPPPAQFTVQVPTPQYVMQSLPEQPLVQSPVWAHVVAQPLPEHPLLQGDDEQVLAQPPEGHAHCAQVCGLRAPPSKGSGIAGPPLGVAEPPEHATSRNSAARARVIP
jgi:hypothetical protein